MNSKTYKSFIVIFILTILISSCCTKQDCEYKDDPELNVQLVDFNHSQQGTVKVYNKTINSFTDSFSFYSNSFRISHSDDTSGLKNKTYFIYSDNNRVDTISNINYEVYEFVNDCNKCFLTSNAAKAIDFRNLQYKLNGKVFTDTEDVNIW